MELRQWYIKEKIKKQDLILEYKLGKKLDADKLTKPTDQPGQLHFASRVLGHSLQDESSPSAPSATSDA
jgi:transposase